MNIWGWFTLDGLSAALGRRCGVTIHDFGDEAKGIPPWSVEVVVPEGEDEEAVAQVLAEQIPIHFVTLGDVERQAMVCGVPRTVRFRRAGRGA